MVVQVPSRYVLILAHTVEEKVLQVLHEHIPEVFHRVGQSCLAKMGSLSEPSFKLAKFLGQSENVEAFLENALENVEYAYPYLCRCLQTKAQ
jgi:hypothetical protein